MESYFAPIVFATLAGAALMTGLLTWLGLTASGNGKTYSLSKLQIGLWTIAIAGTYVWFLAVIFLRPGSGHHGIGISENLLLLMGINAGAYLGAKLIRNAQDTKDEATSIAARTSGLQRLEKYSFTAWRSYFTDYADKLDISKVQMAIWTVVGLLAYMLAFCDMIGGPPDWQSPGLPDVDGMLVTLMGISQSAYLAKKGMETGKEEGAPGPA